MVVRNTGHARFLPLAEQDRGFVHEFRNWNVEILGGRAAADAAGVVVMRAVARAEPAVEVARSVTDRNTAKMRADADLDQPFAGVLARKIGQGAVLVAGIRRALDVRIARDAVRQVRQVDGTGLRDFLFRAMPDEDRLAEE